MATTSIQSASAVSDPTTNTTATTGAAATTNDEQPLIGKLGDAAEQAAIGTDQSPTKIKTL